MTAAAQYRTQIQSTESLMQALQRESMLPEPVLLDAAAKGAIWISLQRGKGQTRPRRLRSLSIEVSEGSEVMLNYDAQVLAKEPQPMRCVSDHVNYGIWFKPAGMLCQGSKWSDHTVATQVAETISGKHCYLVHRLDRAACGLLLIAYTKNALRSLAALFEKRQVSKTYRATVSGCLTQDLPLIIDAPIDGRSALTTVLQTKNDTVENCSLLSLSIDSGRKHQIRRHLADLGHPIVGDRRYAQQNEFAALDLQLVACHLGFTCPFTSEKISVSIDAQESLSQNSVE